METAEGVLRIIVRSVGVALVIAGSWVAYTMVDEAWDLYRDPGRVERFAVAVEQGSNVDSTLGSATAPGKDSKFRPSYFLAWVIALILLLTVARIAIWTIATGGRMALYGTPVRALARDLSREMARSGKAG